MELACIEKNPGATMKTLLLSQLSLQPQECQIRVRICRKWESTAPFLKGSIFSLDCLLVDEEGSSMQATIHKQDAAIFRPQITEGSIYIIQKFTVIPSKKRFAAINRDYMIQITKRTEMSQVEGDSNEIPLYSFNFSAFSKVDQMRYNDSILTDVIGKITSIGDVMHRYIGQSLTPIRNLDIEDSEKNSLSVALWDEFAVSFDEAQLLTKEPDKPVIIILAGMTVRTFKEKIHLSTCSASKIYFNLQIPEVFELLNSLQEKDNSIHRIMCEEEKPIPPEEEMHLNRRTIAELLNSALSVTDNTKFTCECKITDIDTSYGWWYKSCRHCRSAVKIYGDSFLCSRCGNDDQSPIPWYKSNVIVGDESGTTNFTIFGKLAQDLVRIPAHNLAISTNSDNFTLPPVIKALINQEHIFQVMVDAQKFTTNMITFRVLKIFTLNKDKSGQIGSSKTLLLKCEDGSCSTLRKKEVHTELSEETAPIIPSSSSFTQTSEKSSEVSTGKKRYHSSKDTRKSSEVLRVTRHRPSSKDTDQDLGASE